MSPSPQVEYRAFPGSGIEVREAPEGSDFIAVLRGLACPFESDSFPLEDEDGRTYVERVKKGAFLRSLAESPDVVSFDSHDPHKPLGRTPRTLTVSERLAGLGYELRLVDSTATRDILSNVRAGIVRGASIGFLPVREQWRAVGAKIIRTLLDVDLLEVSLTAQPAYPATSCSERALVQFYEMRAAHPRVMEAIVDRGIFIPGDEPIEEPAGAMMSVAEFRRRHPHACFAAEAAEELSGFNDANGAWLVDAALLQRALRDPEAVKRAFDRHVERSAERTEAALASLGRRS
jgi:HK97 family phage prohead protease